ncbi:hypothetical protein SDC9_174955 [bioreactor metagenome]|uniref:Uncharacterized protein n=1 Tax=bioreactor metagenome TaxID=1076179 RepID=A0A645GKN6_9ZZZZ
MLIDYNDARILHSPCLAKGQAIIAAPVVDQDDLQLRIALSKQTVKACVQILSGIVHRYNNADQTFDHQVHSLVFCERIIAQLPCRVKDCFNRANIVKYKGHYSQLKGDDLVFGVKRKESGCVSGFIWHERSVC